MTSQLVGSDFTGAAQLPNYVNGRLLTAEDLATSQATLQAGDSLIGQAAGHGIVTGLWVTSTATTLTVAPGLGIAPSGAAISLAASVTLPLTFAAPTAGAMASGSFSCCSPAPPTGGSAIGAGCYLLTALPAAQLTGQAPLASPPDSTMPSGCTAQWQVQGTQFKAITLQLPDSVLSIPVTDDNRRNLLAHWCFGAPQLVNLGEDLFDFAAGYAGFDTLDPADLSADDVPLAVFYWAGNAIGFVDNWSARRRLTAPDPIPVAVPWAAVVSDRRTADAQARFLQFQDQAAEMVDSGSANSAVAATTFPLLPPVGFLPVSQRQVSDMLGQVRNLADPSRVTAQPGRGRQQTETAATAAETQRLFVADPQTLLRGLAALSGEPLDATIAALAANPPKPGFYPPLFFGGTVRFGGMLDWEIADFLLWQSWQNMPGATTPQPAEGDSVPWSLYVVKQNYLAGLKGSATFYGVFVKNYSWLQGTQPPVIPLVPPSAFE
jgi:hypothetical protein